MPAATYERLLVDTMPARIETDEQYDSIRARLGELLAKRLRGPAEEKLMNLLGVLIEDYDQRHGLRPDDSMPAERLRFLLEHSSKTPVDLLPIFGQRSHTNEALNGKRKTSAEQVRKLRRLFSVQPGLFI
jgi:HTH-type transcriptional regulator/antitoxin HigA